MYRPNSKIEIHTRREKDRKREVRERVKPILNHTSPIWSNKGARKEQKVTWGNRAV